MLCEFFIESKSNIVDTFLLSNDVIISPTFKPACSAGEYFPIVLI